MLKLVIISALVATVTPAVYPGLSPFRQYPTKLPASYNPLPSPTYYPSGRSIAILRSESEIAPDGSQYHFAYDTENGISAQESGSPIGASGSYQYTSPEGVPVQVSYVADANGFQPSGNVLPTPPPIPQAILRSIAYNAAHPETLTRKYYK